MEILSLINSNTLKGLEIQFVHDPFFFSFSQHKEKKKKTLAVCLKHLLNAPV